MTAVSSGAAEVTGPVPEASATENPRLHGVIVTADERTGRATAIERVALSADQIDSLVATAAAAPAGR